jgi:hypothetical protein
VSECRNCGSQETKDLGFIGEIAPFFLKRVLNLEYGLAPSGHPVKRVLRKIGPFSKAFQKVYAKSVLASYRFAIAAPSSRRSDPSQRMRSVAPRKFKRVESASRNG